MKQFNSDSFIRLRGVLVIISSVNFYSFGNATTVLTPLGKITGFYKNSYEGNKYEAFEGIPYAQPPLGDRRFEPPEVIGPWQDELQATKIRKHCWGFDREVYPWGNYLDGDEDCLYLNVYRPINKGETSLLPVIFDIHGGGFQYGTVLPEAARYLIDHDIIFVSIHYRLGILGFLSTEDDVIPGNMGLKDQSMALKWTKENIKSFGGDPNRITLTGLSAGGASVHYHYLSPMSRGLFHSGISFSGTALNSWALIRNSRKRALALGKLMDCTTDNDHSMVQMVRCLKTVPARTLTKAITFFKPWRLMPLVPFGPVVEKSNKSVFIDRFPIEIIESGNVYDAPWITGVVSEEGLYPVAEFLQNEMALKEIDENWNSVAPFLLDYVDLIMYNTPYKDLFAQMIRKHYFGDNAINKENFMTLVHLESDRLFQVDAVKAATEQANVNRNPVWFYLYSYRATNSLSEATSYSTENFGVCHGDDVYMVLGNDEIIPSKTERDMSMHENLVKLWISVAHEGVPDVGVNWLSVDPGKKNFNYLHIAGPGNINSEITEDFGHKSFWNTIDFGLDAEIYYVREGIVNFYAMNFIVPVAENIDELEFTWQSLAGQPLAYSMKLDYETEQGTGYSSGLMALLPPKVNVSSRGFVPIVQQVFAIRLPCTGLESAQIKLALKLNVTAPPDSRYNDIVLVFKRNKVCLLGVRTQSRNDSQDSVRLEASGPLAAGNGVLYVAATCACALIFLVVGVASVVYIRNSKQRSQHPSESCKQGDAIHAIQELELCEKSLTCCSYSAAGTNGLVGSSVLVKVDNRPGSANSGSYATIADLEPLYARPCGSRASYYAASHVTHLSQSTDPCEKARAMSVCRSALHCRSVIQEGTFGRVYRGSLSLAGREQEVIIKTVTEAASAYQASLLVVEGSQLAGLVHGNVVTLAASCLDGGGSPMLAYACAPSDLNLKTYLTDGKHHPSTRDLVNVAVQAARAGAFLHGRGILHRDIAARNCQVDTSSLRTRLADAALSRDLFPQDYHCLGDNENRAIGWMALETLQHGQYSTATDAWSFGVFLWELATMGQQPYAEVDPFELQAFLRDGYRLSQPRPCPDELYALMAVCWLGPARDRPTMPQLLAYLQEFHDALGGFI